MLNPHSRAIWVIPGKGGEGPSPALRAQCTGGTRLAPTSIADRRKEDPMDEIMEMLHDYVTMLACVTAGEPLSSADRARWLALSRILPGTGAPPEPSDEDDDEDGMPVQVTSPGGFESARLLAVSRDGMRLFVAHGLPMGTSTLVRIIAPRTGLEYTFPCKVVWSEGEAIGLAFDGAPGKASLANALLVGWRRPLDLRTGWGSPPAASMA